MARRRVCLGHLGMRQRLQNGKYMLIYLRNTTNGNHSIAMWLEGVSIETAKRRTGHTQVDLFLGLVGLESFGDS